MSNEPQLADATAPGLRRAVVYWMASACLLLGLALGYLLRGSASPQPTPSEQPESPTTAGISHSAPTLQEMKQLADQKAQPLLDQLKNDPGNKDLLIHLAYLYKSAHQFQQAAGYFDRALQSDPKNVSARTEMASCLYYDGDVDGAIRQLQQSLKYDPKDANSLFNLGLVTWKGKNDPAAAIATWHRLLQAHPNLDRKPMVERMIAEARQEQSAH